MDEIKNSPKPQTAHNNEIEELKKELGFMRKRLGGLDDLGGKATDTDSKIQELEETIEEINEKVWELDKSWKNNLVFYGIRQDSGMDEHPSITESKVRTLYYTVYQIQSLKNISKILFQIREIIVRHLRITREVPIIRVKRTTNGPEVRGCKPVTVYFEKWQDKDDILRKANMLRGVNVYIGEDFSKRIRDQVRL